MKWGVSCIAESEEDLGRILAMLKLAGIAAEIGYDCVERPRAPRKTTQERVKLLSPPGQNLAASLDESVAQLSVHKMIGQMILGLPDGATFTRQDVLGALAQFGRKSLAPDFLAYIESGLIERVAHGEYRKRKTRRA